MANFSIGISGIEASQKALDVIGNNIANAATEGFHRQKISLKPAYSSQLGSVLLGGGVAIGSVTREIDDLLEQEILRQNSILEQTSKEYSSLRTIENSFGEFATEQGGLNAAIDFFFTSLDDLAAHPGETVWQNQAVEAAKSMCGQFRTIGDYLTTLEEQVALEVDNTVDRINTLIVQIARYNNDIEKKELGGAMANNLRDQRDQLITEMSEMIGVEVQYRPFGVVDVTAGGIPVVVSSFATQLDTGQTYTGDLGITVEGAYNYQSNIQGGSLGGLLNLKNNLIADIHTDLDSLATAMISEINQIHVQGVGSTDAIGGGSFTSLTGWPQVDDDLADFVPPITSGEIYIRVTDSTGATPTITRYKIEIPTDASSVTEIASYITTNIPGLTASADSSLKLNISASIGYEFDFIPGVLSTPSDVSGLTVSVPSIEISGIYTGSTNQDYICTVIGGGTVSNTNGLQLQIALDGALKTVNIGSGYAAGDRIDIGEGVFISIGNGDFVAGESFTIEALANSDTSGFLAAAGINTFFSGSSASDMDVSNDIKANPSRIATSIGSAMTDSENVKRLSAVQDTAVTDLNNMTCGNYYRKMVADIGQQVSLKEMRLDNVEVMVNNLLNQQGDVSGVNVNDEATQLIVFQQMFQAMAKYINTIQDSINTIIEIL